MAGRNEKGAAVAGFQGFKEAVDAYFAESMRRMQLTSEQIESQDTGALSRSLANVNEALSNVQSFGVCRIKISGNAAAIVVATKSETHFEFGITPLLIEARTRILERLQELGADPDEEEGRALQGQMVRYRNRWLLTLGGAIVGIGLLVILHFPHAYGWTSITSHDKYVPITALACLALVGAVWGALDVDKTRRAFAFGSIVVAAVIGAMTLL